MDGIITNGYIAEPHELSFARVTNVGTNFRLVRNHFTGETINVRAPSRRVSRRTPISRPSELSALAAHEPEYDVYVEATGVSRNLPLAVGSVEHEVWRPADGPYHLDISCHVRSTIVRLAPLDQEDDIVKPPDLAAHVPKFDEDLIDGQRDGFFVHPLTGTIRIPNAAGAMFWIAFEYGKFLFPLLTQGRVDALNVDHVAATMDVRPGDLLVSSELEQRFPGGFPVGVVESVVNDPGKPFAVVQARPSAQLDRSRHVLVVTALAPPAAARPVEPPDAAAEPEPEPQAPVGVSRT